MLRLPFVTPRSGRLLIAVCLVVKLALLVWNSVVFDGKPYDAEHHSDRALFGGLRPGPMAYDPPLYYLPALLVQRPNDVPLVERGPASIGKNEAARPSRTERTTRATKSEKNFRDQLLALLRYTNIFWVGLFYLAWICYAFPRLLGGFQAWFLASLLLLAIPGYQKLAVMSHPDNMFVGATSVAICGWLFLRERWQKSRPHAPVDAAPAHTRSGYGLWHLVAFALVIGLTALTRPFAVVPVAVLSVVAVVYLLRLVGFRWKSLLLRLLLVSAIIGLLGSGWHVYRWKRTGELGHAYHTGDSARFEGRRETFDFVRYYTTFKVVDLLDDPSREIGEGGSSLYADTPIANSFFSLLHSEVWGDQWLYFSGARRDTKVWPKRLVLASALAVPPILAILGGVFAWDLFKRMRAQLLATRGAQLLARLCQLAATLEQELVLLAMTVFGAAFFVCWQAGPALLPGNNATVRFIYVASLFPPALALFFSRALKPLPFNLLSSYFLVLFIAAFPFAMYWPR